MSGAEHEPYEIALRLTIQNELKTGEMAPGWDKEVGMVPTTPPPGPTVIPKPVGIADAMVWIDVTGPSDPLKVEVNLNVSWITETEPSSITVEAVGIGITVVIPGAIKV